LRYIYCTRSAAASNQAFRDKIQTRIPSMRQFGTFRPEDCACGLGTFTSQSSLTESMRRCGDWMSVQRCFVPAAKRRSSEAAHHSWCPGEVIGALSTRGGQAVDAGAGRAVGLPGTTDLLAHEASTRSVLYLAPILHFCPTQRPFPESHTVPTSPATARLGPPTAEQWQTRARRRPGRSSLCPGPPRRRSS
jgi:hypothetical protein